MKKIKTLVILFTVALFVGLSSCHKKDATPVDSLVKIMDDTREQIEKSDDMTDLAKLQTMFTSETISKLLEENSDYKLTDSDKEKLKKSYDSLLRTAFEKTAELGGVSKDAKEQIKQQSEIMVAGANGAIDRAQTIGELSGIK